MIRKLFLFAFICLPGFSGIFAQSDFRPGYVITSGGDTIYGEIDYRGDMMMGGLCRFRTDEGSTIEYSPYQLSAFRFTDSKYFISHEVEGKMVFLEFLISGRLNVFYVRDEEGEHYFVEKDGTGFSELPYEERIIYEGNRFYETTSRNHQGILRYYMKDAPSMGERINEFGEPQHKNLISLAKDYHNLVCTDESCIIYEKKLPAMKFVPELSGGISRYYDSDIAARPFYREGIIMHLWLPRQNERLFLRTGVLYQQMEIDERTLNTFILPLQLEYNFQHSRIHPSLSYGMFIYSPVWVTVETEVGIGVNLTRSLEFSLHAGMEFYELLIIIPTGFLAWNVSAGLALRL